MMCVTIEKAKSELIQEFLFDWVKSLSKDFPYIKVNDSNMLNDDEMYIFIDREYNEEDFNSVNMYKLHLLDFKIKCDEFIKELKENLPKNLVFSHNYIPTIMDNKEYCESCELHFKIEYVIL